MGLSFFEGVRVIMANIRKVIIIALILFVLATLKFGWVLVWVFTSIGFWVWLGVSWRGKKLSKKYFGKVIK